MMSTHQAARRAGITIRQADYWANRGVFGDELVGCGSGSRRNWFGPDVAALCAVAAYARFIHGLDDASNSAAVLGPAPGIAATVRQTPDADWLVVAPDRTASAHPTLVDAVRAVTLRGGILLDLAPSRAQAA